MTAVVKAPVLVVGAGVVGCATAYLLARAGHRVRLLDRASACAQGASYANGAQLSYSFVEPLATPSLVSKLPGIILGRDPALRFEPRASFAQWRWGAQFLLSCRERVVDATTQSLLQLAESSRIEIRNLLDDGLQFGYAKSGKLVLLNSLLAQQRACDTVWRQQRFGARQRLLSRNDVVALEPALAPTQSQFVGAIWSEDDALCDPQRLCTALIDAAREHDFEVTFDCAVLGFRVEPRRITHLLTTAGDLVASAVIVANGVDAPALLRKLGIAAPIEPIKGYSITIPAAELRNMPRISITDLAKKIVYAPLEDHLRVAGFAELSSRDTQAHEAKIRSLLEATRARFGLSENLGNLSAWAGLRPATPTAHPIIGRRKYENLFLNVGHGALGLTLAMGSARSIEQMMADAY